MSDAKTETKTDAPAKPGTLIRTEAQPAETSLAEAGQAMRILYSSTNGLDGKTVLNGAGAPGAGLRSDERRVGEAGVGSCSSRWSADQ